jgi:hypothetical protein
MIFLRINIGMLLKQRGKAGTYPIAGGHASSKLELEQLALRSEITSWTQRRICNVSNCDTNRGCNRLSLTPSPVCAPYGATSSFAYYKEVRGWMQAPDHRGTGERLWIGTVKQWMELVVWMQLISAVNSRLSHRVLALPPLPTSAI